MYDKRAFDTKICELIMDYKEMVSTTRLIREATNNEYDEIELKDISRSLNMLVVKMEDIDERIGEIYEVIQKLL